MRIITCLTVLFFSQFISSQKNIYQSLLIDNQLKENANAVVRLDDISVSINSINDMVITKERVVTVLNKLGNDYVNAREWYNDGVEIKNIQAIIYDQLGNEIYKKKQKDFNDVSAVGGGTLYSDSRIIYLAYTPTSYPYTIKFTSEIRTKNTGNVPNWYFLNGYLVSTEKSRYKINFATPDLKPVFKEKNFENMAITKAETDNSILYEGSNITAIKRESLSPSFQKIVPQIMARMVNFYYGGYSGEIKDWKDVGLWMHNNLIQGRDELFPETKSMVHSLVANTTDDLEKAKIIYKYVQDNTRYISVQVGIGGLQPIAAVDVDRVKYGDCKGLSNYTKALLKEVGVTSYYTHVESGNYKVSFETDFPDLGAGDHVILAVPYKDKLYWIDCTSQIHPFGFIGDFTDGRQVLLIKPEGGELVTTTAYVNEENSQKITGNYTLSDDNSITAAITIKTKGVQYDDHFPMQLKSKDDIIKDYKENWGNINNLNIENFEFNNDRENVEFTETINVSAINYGSKSGERLLFVVNAFNKNNYVPDRYRNRLMPLEIQRGYLDEDEFVINLPAGYKIEALPEPIEIENEFGSYKANVEKTKDGNSLIYSRRLLIKEGEYPKEKYEEYRTFRKDISSNDNAKIVLIKN